MRFNPRSSEDIEAELKENAAKFAPWPTGAYDFEVLSSVDTTSNAGNDMIVLELSVFNAAGERRTIKDYLLEAMAAKLRHAAEACDLVSEYDAGTMDATDFLGKTGQVKLGIQPPKDGYPAKNTVKDYVSAPAAVRAVDRKEQKVTSRATTTKEDLNDDIPF